MVHDKLSIVTPKPQISHRPWSENNQRRNKCIVDVACNIYRQMLIKVPKHLQQLSCDADWQSVKRCRLQQKCTEVESKQNCIITASYTLGTCPCSPQCGQSTGLYATQGTRIQELILCKNNTNTDGGIVTTQHSISNNSQTPYKTSDALSNRGIEHLWCTPHTAKQRPVRINSPLD